MIKYQELRAKWDNIGTCWHTWLQSLLVAIDVSPNDSKVGCLRMTSSKEHINWSSYNGEQYRDKHARRLLKNEAKLRTFISFISNSKNYSSSSERTKVSKSKAYVSSSYLDTLTSVNLVFLKNVDDLWVKKLLKRKKMKNY